MSAVLLNTCTLERNDGEKIALFQISVLQPLVFNDLVNMLILTRMYYFMLVRDGLCIMRYICTFVLYQFEQTRCDKL